MPYEIVDVSEIESPNGVFKPLRQSLGVSAFGINQLELPANAEGPEHDHGEDGQEEVYAIVGEAERSGSRVRSATSIPASSSSSGRARPARWSPARTGSPGSGSVASQAPTRRRRCSRRMLELALVEFPADDLERARRFWEGLLGEPFDEREEGEGRGWQTGTDGVAARVARAWAGTG